MKPIVVILAGGIGRRFRPFQISKPLYKVLGQTLIERTVQKAQKAGFEQFVIVTNPKDQTVIDPLFRNQKNIQTVIQVDPCGMGNALLSVKKQVNDHPIIVLNATDQVEQKLFDQMFKKAKLKKPFVVGKKVTEYFNGGYLVINWKKLKGVMEKPGAGNEPSDMINLVFHFFPNASDFIKIIEKTPPDISRQYEDALTSYMQKTDFSVIEYDGYWQATKYPWDILLMTKTLLENELKKGVKTNQIDPTAKIDKNVYLGEGVIIYENAVIKGPSYIGANSVVGNNTVIRQSYVGEDSVIGTNCELVRSYIGDHCWLHQNYVGDSVLESNVAMGAGAVTANFRLDEQSVPFHVDRQKIDTGMDHLGALIAADVRIGVNSSLMPGIKIGHNTIIGPNTLVEKDVERFTGVFSQSTTKEVPFKGTIQKRT